MSEVTYKTIDRFPGYRFGCDGSVWSSHRGQWTGHPWRKLNPKLDKDGYRLLQTSRRNGPKRTWARVARLILEAFVGPAPEGQQACHIDGSQTNDAIENLRWDSPKANCDDKRRHGTNALRERRKLTWEQACRVRELRAEGYSYRRIEQLMGVSDSVIYGILKGKTYQVQ